MQYHNREKAPINLRQELLQIINKHLQPQQLHRLFKTALPALQEFKQFILSSTTDDKTLLIATHELCQRALFQAVTNDLEDELTSFFKKIGIKNYFVKDSTQNFIKKCEYFKLTSNEHKKDIEKFRI